MEVIILDKVVKGGYFKFVGHREDGVVVVKSVCGKCKVFSVSDWKDLISSCHEAGEFLENCVRDEMWSEMCMFCVEIEKCKFVRGLPDSPFDLYRVDKDTVVRIDV
jgi:hypothetical protein